MDTTIKIISTICKLAGVVGYFTGYLDPKTAATVVLIASTAKDTLTVIGDVLDDGKRNDSFKP